MKVDQEMLNKTIGEMLNYEKSNLGIKYGEGFVDVAKAIQNSENSLSLCIPILIDMMIGKEELVQKMESFKGQPKEVFTKGIISSFPGFESVCMAFYAGYRFGMKCRDLEVLENMADNNSPLPSR